MRYSFCLRRKSFPGRNLSFTRRCCGRSGSSVVSDGCPCNRTSLPLTLASHRQGPLAPRELPRFIATMGPSDSPHATTRGYEAAERLHSPAGMRGLSVPDLVFRHAPSSSTPGSRPVALTRFFSGRAGFVTFDRLATPDWRNEAHTGSLSLRLAPSPNNLGLRMSDCSNHTPSRLHGQRVITKANSFQFARTRSVSLTHRRREEMQRRKSFCLSRFRAI